MQYRESMDGARTLNANDGQVLQYESTKHTAAWFPTNPIATAQANG